MSTAYLLGCLLICEGGIPVISQLSFSSERHPTREVGPDANGQFRVPLVLHQAHGETYHQAHEQLLRELESLPWYGHVQPLLGYEGNPRTHAQLHSSIVRTKAIERIGRMALDDVRMIFTRADRFSGVLESLLDKRKIGGGS